MVILVIAEMVGIILSNVIMYQIVSKTMDKIKQNLPTGIGQSDNCVERKKELLTAEYSCPSKEHSHLSQEHMDIHDTIKEVHTRQKEELKLQRIITDKLPDAKMLKEDIQQIYMETMNLKIELIKLKNEMQQVKEKNKEMLVEFQQMKNHPLVNAFQYIREKSYED